MSICLELFEGEFSRLNRLLDDSNATISALLKLLRDHNVPVGSPELIKAREKVEAEIQTLRTANAGLVDRVKRLEAAGDKLIDAVYSVQCWSGTHVGDCADEFESVKGQP